MSNAIYPPYNQHATQSNLNPFDLYGHPGKFHKSIAASGTVWFTGSNFGAGAVLPGTASAGTYTWQTAEHLMHHILHLDTYMSYRLNM